MWLREAGSCASYGQSDYVLTVWLLCVLLIPSRRIFLASQNRRVAKHYRFLFSSLSPHTHYTPASPPPNPRLIPTSSPPHPHLVLASSPLHPHSIPTISPPSTWSRLIPASPRPLCLMKIGLSRLSAVVCRYLIVLLLYGDMTMYTDILTQYMAIACRYSTVCKGLTT